MKVADLKKELKSRGLSVTGNKTELIERLQMAAGSSGTVGDASVLEEDDTALLEEADDILGEDDDTPGMLANGNHYKVTLVFQLEEVCGTNIVVHKMKNVSGGI